MVINSRNIIITLSQRHRSRVTNAREFLSRVFLPLCLPETAHNAAVEERNDDAAVVKGGRTGCTSSDYPRVVSKGRGEEREGDINHRGKEVSTAWWKTQQRGCHLHGNSRARDASRNFRS